MEQKFTAGQAILVPQEGKMVPARFVRMHEKNEGVVIARLPQGNLRNYDESFVELPETPAADE